MIDDDKLKTQYFFELKDTRKTKAAFYKKLN